MSLLPAGLHHNARPSGRSARCGGPADRSKRCDRQGEPVGGSGQKRCARQGEPVGGSGHLLPARSPIHGLTRGARLLPRCRRSALTTAARPPGTALTTAARHDRRVRVAAACSRDQPTVSDPRRARGPRRQARPARSAPWPTKAGALVEVASLSADRATCFPRDRASCPHARRSAPASLPQVGPHRRGSPARHRASSQRCLVTPICSGSDSCNRPAGCFVPRPTGNDPRRARGPWGSQEAHMTCAVRRLRSGTRSRRRP